MMHDQKNIKLHVLLFKSRITFVYKDILNTV